MLEQVNLKQKLAKEDYQVVTPALKVKLAAPGTPFRAANLSAIPIFEGWSVAGKGQMIGQLIKDLDPRWFTVVNTQSPTELEQHYPYLCRHWYTIPEAGKLSIMDRSWYREVSVCAIVDKLPVHTMETRLADIRRLEKTFTDNGYLILRSFLHTSKREIKARPETLTKNPETAFRAVKPDREQVKHYDDYYAALGRMLAETTIAETSWILVFGTDRRVATAQVFRIVIDATSERLNRSTPPQTITLPNEDTADVALCLPDIDLS